MYVLSYDIEHKLSLDSLGLKVISKADKWGNLGQAACLPPYFFPHLSKSNDNSNNFMPHQRMAIKIKMFIYAKHMEWCLAHRGTVYEEALIA